MHWNHWPHNDIEQMLINGLSIKYETELLKKILAIETKEDCPKIAHNEEPVCSRSTSGPGGVLNLYT